MQVGRITLLDPVTKVGIVSVVPRRSELRKKVDALFTVSDLIGITFDQLRLEMIVEVEYVDLATMADATKIAPIEDSFWRSGTVKLILVDTGVIVDGTESNTSIPVCFHKNFVLADREFEKWSTKQRKTGQKIDAPVRYILDSEATKPWAIVVLPE